MKSLPKTRRPSRRFRHRRTLPVGRSPAVCGLALALVIGSSTVRAQQDQAGSREGPIPIAVIERQQPVTFDRDLLPIFQSKCLSCHSKSLALGNVVLEDSRLIRAGDRQEPLVIPGNGDDSLLLQVAAHLRQPFMPPAGNDAEAESLSPEELGLLKLWIDQGAHHGSEGRDSPPLEWQSIPDVLAPVYSVAISPDGRYAATGRSNRIVVYDLNSGQLSARLVDPTLVRTGLYGEPGVSHRDMVHSLAFSPDGRLLVSGGYRTIKFWRLQASDPTGSSDRPDREGKPLSGVLERVVGDAEDPSTFIGRVTALAFSPDGTLLATGSGDPSRSGELKIWRTEGGDFAGEIPDAHIDTILGLAFSPDGQYLASGSSDRFVKVFDVKTRQLARTFEGHTHHVLDVAWKTDGKVLASCGADNVVKLWDFETAEQKKTIGGYEKEITSLSFIGDSDRLLISSGDPTVRFGERRLSGVSSFIHTAAVSPDGQTIVAGDQDGRLLVWRSTQARPIHVLGSGPSSPGSASGK